MDTNEIKSLKNASVEAYQLINSILQTDYSILDEDLQSNLCVVEYKLRESLRSFGLYPIKQEKRDVEADLIQAQKELMKALNLNE